MPKENENGYSQEEETVILTDENGRQLVCAIEQPLPVEGKEYFLLRPLDETVEIFAWEETPEGEEAILLETEEQMDAVFPDAQAVLAEQELALQRSAYALTVIGDVPDPEEDDILTLEIEDEGAPLEPEQLQYLATFYHEEREFEIYRRLNPLLLFGTYNSAGEMELLSPEEFHKVQPMLEEQLALIEEQMFGEAE